MYKEYFRKDFLDQLNPAQQLRELFEYLPDTYFFMKDKESRFVSVNPVFIEMCNQTSEKDIIGKNDYDFFPRDRAEKYINDDKHVMRTGIPMINIVELAPEKIQSTNWVIVSKIPLFNRSNQVIGTAGIGKNYNKARSTLQPYSEFAEVIKYIDDHYDSEIEIRSLANMVNLSISQFERKFKKTFQITPLQHIMQVRMKAACHAITTTDKSISTIALKCGFYDHSHFTRHFRKIIGVPPKEYRKRY